MRGLVAVVALSGVLVLGFLTGCASGPSPEELARQAREQEQRQERERQAKAEQEAKRQAELKKVRDELDALLANVAAAEQRGMTAEQRGEPRKAFQEYVGAVQALTRRRELWAANLDRAMQANQTIRERLFAVTRRLDPPPAVSEEAERYFLRGMAGMKTAASTDDYRQITKEFIKALDLAPWWGDVYFNLAVVGEKDGTSAEQVVRSYRYYLQANPGAPDAGAVKAKIAEVEYNQERTVRLIQGWKGLYRVAQSAGTVEHWFQCGSGQHVPPMRLSVPLEISIESVDLATRQATGKLLRSTMKDAWAGNVDAMGVVLHTASPSENSIEIKRTTDSLLLQAKVRYNYVENYNDVPCHTWGKYEGPIEKASDAPLDDAMRGLLEGTMPGKSKR